LSPPVAPAISLAAILRRRFIIRAQRTLRIREIIVISDGIRPVARNIGLAIGKMRPGPRAARRWNERRFPPRAITLREEGAGRGCKCDGEGAKQDKFCAGSHGHLSYFEDGTG
jgi:hypothetical protein